MNQIRNVENKQTQELSFDWDAEAREVIMRSNNNMISEERGHPAEFLRMLKNAQLQLKATEERISNIDEEMRQAKEKTLEQLKNHQEKLAKDVELLLEQKPKWEEEAQKNPQPELNQEA